MILSVLMLVAVVVFDVLQSVYCHSSELLLWWYYLVWFLGWGLWFFVLLMVVNMVVLDCDETLVLVVVVTVNGLYLEGWSEDLSVWSLRLLFEG